MKRTGSLVLVPVLAALAPAPVALADVIVQADGQLIEDVMVEEESLAQVTYTKDGRKQEVPSDGVLRVEYASASFPKELGDAVAALDDGDDLTAYQLFEEYVQAQIEEPRARRKWAPPYAAWMTVDLSRRLGNDDSIVSNAARLLRAFPSSRYVPYALLARFDSELDRGETSTAESTLGKLAEVIQSAGLSARWQLTHELSKIVADPRSNADAKRRALRDVVRRAGDHPLVVARARVAEGETYIVEADGKTDPAAAQELRKSAQAIFEQVIEGAAEPATLAAAYCGIGESLFYEGASKDDTALLQRAADQFLRVIVLYPGEGRYVSKSLFFAMRAFTLMGDRARSLDMRRELKSTFAGSRWDGEADKFK